MALFVHSLDPILLLRNIKIAIDQKHIDTWEYDSDGDFTHSPPQWREKAWLRPTVFEGMLSFGIVRPKNVSLTCGIYAIYHGRFAEMLLAHFDKHFSLVQATALLQSPDVDK